MKRKVKKIIKKFNFKRALKKSLNMVQIFFQFYYNNYFNSIVKSQQKDFKTVPIIIISFNQLLYLKKLIKFLELKKYKNIIIIDNNSTYEPLLEYFEEIKNNIKIHILNENKGHKVFWEKEEIFKEYSKGYYAITDADIVPNPDCPEDFLNYFKKVLDCNRSITKVGFSLQLDDIPSTNSNRDKILDWESQFYIHKTKQGDFKGKIDTTFALYRPQYKYNKSTFLNGIRARKPYEAIHGGWYIDYEHLTEEQKYFYKTCNESSSWRIDAKGSLKDSLYLSE